MLTPDKIRAAAHDLESFQVERKASFKPVKSEIEEAICAFANDLPQGGRGLLLIGVEDKTGRPTGIAVTDELLREVTDIRSAGNILPLPLMHPYRASLDGQDIIVIEVEPSEDTPVRLRGRVCIRVGPRKGTASREEERLLTERRRGFDLPFDGRPVRSATLADIDLERLRQEYLPLAIDAATLAENERPLDYQLESLHLVDSKGIPTAALLLLYGREPRYWLPGAYLQFVRFDGPELADPVIDQHEINGNVSDVLRRIDELVRLNIRTTLDLSGVVHKASPAYPFEALQQLIRNAVLHRSYENNAPVRVYWFSDRVEILSPGGLYGRVTPENFGQRGATDYRNHTLAAGLKVLGFVQTFGVGIALARRYAERNGNPAPRFEFGPVAVDAIVEART